MNNEKPPPAEKSMFEGTVDSITGTIGLLWNMLSNPPKKTESEDSSLLDWLPDSVEPKPDNQIPAQVVDTEGESEDA